MSKPLNKVRQLYCGTSNVVLPVPNKSHFPPEYRDKSRLHYYATLFNSVEINNSFYKIPMPRTVEKWANEVPANFRFTFKLWQGITHAKGLIYDAADVSKFMQAINMAGDKKGCLLIQFPASIKVSYLHHFKRLMDDIHAANAGWQMAIEFRDKSWYHDIVYELLEHYAATIVVHDMPASATPLIDMETSCIYLRFHGHKGDYRGGYTEEALREYAMDIKSSIKKKKTVYAYFNNTMGDAVFNAMTLNTLATGRQRNK